MIIGVIAYLAGSRYGFGPGYKTEAGVSVNPYARGSILVLILGSVFVGLSTGIQEIVKENQIRIREQAVGIKPISYLLSKFIVLGAIVLIQMFVFVQIVVWGRPLPKSGLIISSSRVEMIAICSALAFSSMVLGVFISSLISSSEQAMPALVGMTMVQVVLSGALPLSTGGAIDKLSIFSPSYWATNGLSASVDLVQISRISEPAQQEKWSSSISNLSQSYWHLLLFVLLFSIGSLMKVRKTR
jgi:hypothetical protein